MLFEGWASVVDGGPTLIQHWIIICIPANWRHTPSSGVMLGQRRRRW